MVKILSIRQKLYIKYLLSKTTSEFDSLKSQKKIVVALAADYGNLGDVAITYAQTKFLKLHYPEYKIIDFPISKTFTSIKALKKVINSHDVISIVGGGNTGDLYDDIEYCRQFIIKQFPDNKIISFPQTIDFSNTNKGIKALKKAIKVYSSHKDLTLAAREESSFKKFKEFFPENNVVFTPDIVLSINEEQPTYERNNVTLCLRRDKEKLIGKDQEKLLVEHLNKHYHITFNDTHINKNNLSIEERKYELNEIWTTFKKSKVVVTDRLHGMIFCAITKTPCIAIDNSNRKISGVYSAWLKDLGYIKLVKELNVEELTVLIEELSNFESTSYMTVDLNEKFSVLMNLHYNGQV